MLQTEHDEKTIPEIRARRQLFNLMLHEFLQPSGKMSGRVPTIGHKERAMYDSGNMWAFRSKTWSTFDAMDVFSQFKWG